MTKEFTQDMHDMTDRQQNHKPVLFTLRAVEEGTLDPLICLSFATLSTNDLLFIKKLHKTVIKSIIICVK